MKWTPKPINPLSYLRWDFALWPQFCDCCKKKFWFERSWGFTHSESGGSQAVHIICRTCAPTKQEADDFYKRRGTCCQSAYAPKGLSEIEKFLTGTPWMEYITCISHSWMYRGTRTLEELQSGEPLQKDDMIVLITPSGGVKIVNYNGVIHRIIPNDLERF